MNRLSSLRTIRPGTLSIVVAVSSTSLAAFLLLPRQPLRTDSPDTSAAYLKQCQLQIASLRPTLFLWGQSKTGAVDVKRPSVYLEDVLLRDLVLHARYGVMVDERGDVLQFGKGYDETSTLPEITLRGKQIKSVAASDDKVFALSKAGEVYIFSASKERQTLGAEQREGQDAWWKYLIGLGSVDAGIDYQKLSTDVVLNKNEKFVSISAGRSHLVALTSSGRAFASPLNLSANSHGQLAVKKVALLSVPSSRLESGAQLVTLIPDPRINEVIREVGPPPRLDPLLLNADGGRASVVAAPVTVAAPLPPAFVQPQLHADSTIHSQLEKSIRFSTTLHQIPSLRSLTIAQIVAGDRHTLARTAEGRVLGFGANNYGQLGLGSSLSFASIPAPTEIPMARAFPKTTRLNVERIAAGGNVSYFVVESEDISNSRKTISLLATGHGQHGSIGNANWSHAASPIRVKTISGLLEWNDASQEIEPIAIKEISVGNTHIAVVLDNAIVQDNGVSYGRDVFVFGKNEYGELGTGKRNSLSSPQHLPPLPYSGLTAPVEGSADATISSNTLSPMPHNRLQLAPEFKWKGHRVEETVVAGYDSSAVYWKILD